MANTIIPPPLAKNPYAEPRVVGEDKKISARSAAMHLITAFTWQSSREGDMFWSAVHTRLLDISNGDKI